jgi:YegS/Rv2252/BmrU family lipid kinase
MRRYLDEIGPHCTLKLTKNPGAARVLAREAVVEGHEIVVAAGGDGTLNEVLNGIGDVPGAFEFVRLGVLPLGTVNVFARELGIPRQLPHAWRIVLGGRERRIDLPRVEFQQHGRGATRYFAQLAGAGLDARAIQLVDWGLKKRFGPIAYVLAGLRAMRGPHDLIFVDIAGQTTTGQLVLIGNGRFYGGSLVMFPEADLGDGNLDVRVFSKVSWKVLLECGIGLLTRNLPKAAGGVCLRAPDFVLRGPPETLFEVDGELIGNLPARFRIEPQALRVLTN